MKIIQQFYFIKANNGQMSSFWWQLWQFSYSIVHDIFCYDSCNRAVQKVIGYWQDRFLNCFLIVKGEPCKEGGLINDEIWEEIWTQTALAICKLKSVDLLTLVDNVSLKTAAALQAWRVANITPFFTKGYRDLGNSRQMSLTSLPGNLV